MGETTPDALLGETPRPHWLPLIPSPNPQRGPRVPRKPTVYTQVLFPISLGISELPPLIPPYQGGKLEILFPPLNKATVYTQVLFPLGSRNYPP